ncbi:SANT/Myb_domain [Hexamita inflata]|uniref:SANT/Myb_domain n=1 Tax=Hexamita inflata TaxID=28002 RepID=A0ABP1KHN4_9EUKA
MTYSSKARWTDEEERLFAQLLIQCQNNFREVTKHLGTRTYGQTRRQIIQYFSILQIVNLIYMIIDSLQFSNIFESLTFNTNFFKFINNMVIFELFSILYWLLRETCNNSLSIQRIYICKSQTKNSQIMKLKTL